jgi:hypothetical protein
VGGARQYARQSQPSRVAEACRRAATHVLWMASLEPVPLPFGVCPTATFAPLVHPLVADRRYVLLTVVKPNVVLRSVDGLGGGRAMNPARVPRPGSSQGNPSVGSMRRRGASANSEPRRASDGLLRDAVPPMSVHSTGLVTVVAVLIMVGLRLLLKTAKLGLLLAVVLVYVLYMR